MVSIGLKCQTIKIVKQFILVATLTVFIFMSAAAKKNNNTRKTNRLNQGLKISKCLQGV